MEINQSIKSKFNQYYQRGLDGYNKGLPIPLDHLNSYLCGIQKGVTTVLAGASGSGKSTMVNEIAISYPLQFLKDNPDRPEKYHCEYFNLEIQDIDVLAKFKANHIFKESNYQVKLSPNKIFQKGDFLLTDTEKMWIDKSDEYIDELLKNVNFIAGENITVGYFYKRLFELARQFGTMEKDEEGRELLHTWVAKDPNQYVVVVFDNVNNLNDKAKIDELSSICVKFRKNCDFTFYLVQQYNRQQESNFNHGGFQEPVISDLKETSRTAA
jgi:DnaB-like helicase C terminal domain